LSERDFGEEYKYLDFKLGIRKRNALRRQSLSCRAG